MVGHYPNSGFEGSIAALCKPAACVLVDNGFGPEMEPRLQALRHQGVETILIVANHGIATAINQGIVPSSLRARR